MKEIQCCFIAPSIWFAISFLPTLDLCLFSGSEVSRFYFTMNSYSIKIPSNLPVNETILQIYTRPVTNQSFSYVLQLAVDEEPNALNGEVQEFFGIDQESGQIFLQQPFDSKGNLTGIFWKGAQFNFGKDRNIAKLWFY